MNPSPSQPSPAPFPEDPGDPQDQLESSGKLDFVGRCNTLESFLSDDDVQFFGKLKEHL